MKSASIILFIFSGVAALLSAIVSVGKMEAWLAGTQWMLVAVVLAVYAVYFELRSKA